jgi:hypothetical protein
MWMNFLSWKQSDRSWGMTSVSMKKWSDQTRNESEIIIAKKVR